MRHRNARFHGEVRRSIARLMSLWAGWSETRGATTTRRGLSRDSPPTGVSDTELPFLLPVGAMAKQRTSSLAILPAGREFRY